ncbi:MAG: DUF87 domain-containing protein [Woeseiaceae bacterium]|nr:DUF87 domain-containing protein [Woeseiaceae bacterium]
MYDFEKLGAFYLGRRVDDAGEIGSDLVLYDSRDLTTHAVIIGMTGSGKTGLGVGLIEEAALDRVPVIAIDPKGDMANLLLTFPQLSAAEFRPWVNPRAATDAGQTVDEYAAAQASLWKKGLGQWGQDGERIRALRDTAEFRLYTPGSTAAAPISVLDSFTVPNDALFADTDLYRDRIQATATGLLSLIGEDADPLTSREHILVSQIIDHAWQARRSLDIAALIAAIQNPPVARVGVMDVDSFFPAKERFGFAMKLNNLLAAPGFATWMEGEPLDAQRLFYAESGKPRVSVLSIAHLSDDERMFFVTMLLSEIIAWMRAQQGTSSLRAILYMDEVFGYLPPTANPPSKKLFLTLLKQARAYGLGVVLSTQNPVDLDYKALSNAGTWFIGRLQTERDMARMMDGLEGVAGGRPFDKQATERTIAGLGKRRFLLHNVHEDEDAVFGTRWVMSYLAGPMTRDQLARLAADQAPSAGAAGSPKEAPPAQKGQRNGPGDVAPIVPPEISVSFVPSDHEGVTYFPRLIAAAETRISSARYNVETEPREELLSLEVDDRAADADWEAAETLALGLGDLRGEPAEGARFSACPAALLSPDTYDDCGRDLKRWLRQSRALTLYRSGKYRLTSEPGESEGEFRSRLQQTMNEQRDQAIARLRKRYASKANTLENRVLRARQRVETEQQQSTQSNLDTALSFGTAILGAVLGRKRLSSATAGKVGTAIKRAGSARKQRADIERAKELLAKAETELETLNDDLQREIDELEGDYDALAEELSETVIRPKVSDVHVTHVGLAWMPYADRGKGRFDPAW